MKTTLLFLLILTIHVGNIFSQTEIIVDGNFSTMNSAWITSGDFHYGQTYTNSPCGSPPTGYAYIASATGSPDNNLSGTIKQFVTIPVNCSSATLSFCWNATGTENATGHDGLTAFISLVNSPYTWYMAAQPWVIGNVSGNTLTYTLTDPNLLMAGTQLSIEFDGATNSSLPSTIRLDNVSFTYVACTLPNAPTGLTATPVSSSQINISWNSVSGATNYEVDYGLGSCPWSSGGSNLTTTTSTTTTATGLSPNTTYRFIVIAENSCGWGTTYNCISATTLSSGTTPPTPIGFNATATSSSSIYLSWNTSTGATSYDIYTCTGSLLNNTSNTNYTVTGLNPSTYYDYKVKAKNTYGSSSFTSCQGVTTLSGGTAPPTPTGLTATATSNSTINLNWNSSTGATNYDVYTCSGSFLANTSNTYYSITGLNANTFYDYKIKAKNTYGSSSFTSCQGATTLGSGLPTVTITSPNGGENWTIGTSYNITASIIGTIYSKLLEISYDGGATWGSCIGYIPTSSNILNYSWTPAIQTSNFCKIRVTVNYSGGSVSDVSNGNFTISTPGTGQPFELNSTISHLFWPFYNSNFSGNPVSNWATHPVNLWQSGTEDGIGGANGHGESGHTGADYFADDWNWGTTIQDCDLDFFSPIEGTVIFTKNSCSTACVSDPNSCGGYYSSPKSYGNQVIIQSTINPNYAFRVTHLNTVSVISDQHVMVGTKLGTIGSTGASTFSHAHCVLYKRINETYPPFFTTTGIARLQLGMNLINNASDVNNKFKDNFLFDATTMTGSGGAGSDSSWATITTSGNTSFCNGDSVLLIANTGISYYWSTGQTTQSIYASIGGAYYVVVADSNGDNHASIPIYINVIQPPIANIVTNNNFSSFCQGDSLTLIASEEFAAIEGDIEENSMTFSWSNGNTNYYTPVFNAGTYSVTITNYCGSSTNSHTVTTVPPPTQPTVQVNGNSLACNTSNGVTYQWNYNGLPLLNDTLQILNADSTGYYTVTIFNIITGCSSTSTPIYVAVGIENVNSVNSLKIYPNPTNNKLNIEFDLANSHKEISLKLFNSLGQVVLFDKITNSQSGTIKKIFNVQNIGDGVYQLQIKLEDGTTLIRKIMIQK